MKWISYLLHLTHYAPGDWHTNKPTEERFDRKTAEDCIREAAKAGFNLLILDIKDAVIYKTLPHLKKRYSVPMRELKELTALARSLGLEVVPKLNFSRSGHHRHSHWLWESQRVPDTAVLWKDALKAIDEIISVMKPTLLHVGMDEDDTRSPDEFAKALKFLYRSLKKRKLRMVMWADCGHNWREAERWKVLPAIHELPRDVILMPWDYQKPLEDFTRKFQRQGFDVIGTASGILDYNKKPWTWSTQNTQDWLRTLQQNRSAGICVTHWMPASAQNREFFIDGLRQCQPLFETVDLRS